MRRLLALAIIFVFFCSSVSFAKVVKQYYPNKKTRSVIKYNEKKQLDGTYKLFWSNGRLKEKGRYKDGRHVGETKRYSSDGVLEK